jgi:rRNA-processing protein FCF1
MVKSAVRRTVIREWMALAREKRQTEDQAVAFANQVAQQYRLSGSHRDPCTIIKAWL